MIYNNISNFQLNLICPNIRSCRIGGAFLRWISRSLLYCTSSTAWFLVFANRIARVLSAFILSEREADLYLSQWFIECNTLIIFSLHLKVGFQGCPLAWAGPVDCVWLLTSYWDALLIVISLLDDLSLETIFIILQAATSCVCSI